MLDSDLYQIIADEMAAKQIDKALWTQAIEISEGNPDKTQATYIRLRFAALKKSAVQMINSAAPKNVQMVTNSQSNDLLELRSKLTSSFSAKQQTSLYTILGLYPNATDELIGSAIADYEAKIQNGSEVNLSAFKYTKDTLCNPKLREQYDRKLFENLQADEQVLMSMHKSGSRNDSIWDSSKTSVIIGVLSVTLIGYLGLGFFQAHGGQQVSHQLVDVQRESKQLDTGIDQQKIEIEEERAQADIDLKQKALSIAEERQRSDMEYRDRMQQQMQEQREQELQRRADLDATRLKQQQQQTENMKLAREKNYWACMNQQLYKANASATDATSRCGGRP